MITISPRRFCLLFTSVALTLMTPLSAKATIFQAQEVEQANFIAVARPYGNKYDLLIIQQIPSQRQCWDESGANPTIVQPLLLNFDFTGSCERSTDSNGYSLRLDGEDYGMTYLLRIVEKNGDLFLVGTNRSNPGQEIVIGRTGGVSAGLLKIQLNGGWRFTKRSFAGKSLGHVYLTADTKDLNAPAGNIVQQSPPTNDTRKTAKELTFTAPTTPTTAVNPPARNVNDVAPPPRLPETSPSTLKPPAPPINSLPPLPTPENNNGRIVPPPPLSGGNSNKRPSLSEVLARNSTVAAPSRSNNFRVMVEAKSGNDRTQLKSRFPDAFPTSYKGRSLWQVGVFSSREKAESALNNVASLGLQGIIVPF
ncbi:MAG: hypothetical protein N5P05_002992 [Chroococcopsis gigantea SAG 12.99]|jgi:hypothetical protein|nr:DUF3747 domain-containing protein [Chlorogloea purpurea SAG 13.99]MDV3001386.1 hypothetical protein [Chroococcopsis gigantea SAG 12.99]